MENRWSLLAVGLIISSALPHSTAAQVSGLPSECDRPQPTIDALRDPTVELDSAVLDAFYLRFNQGTAARLAILRGLPDSSRIWDLWARDSATIEHTLAHTLFDDLHRSDQAAYAASVLYALHSGRQRPILAALGASSSAVSRRSLALGAIRHPDSTRDEQEYLVAESCAALRLLQAIPESLALGPPYRSIESDLLDWLFAAYRLLTPERREPLTSYILRLRPAFTPLRLRFVDYAFP